MDVDRATRAAPLPTPERAMTLLDMIKKRCLHGNWDDVTPRCVFLLYTNTVYPVQYVQYRASVTPCCHLSSCIPLSLVESLYLTLPYSTSLHLTLALLTSAVDAQE